MVSAGGLAKSKAEVAEPKSSSRLASNFPLSFCNTSHKTFERERERRREWTVLLRAEACWEGVVF